MVESRKEDRRRKILVVDDSATCRAYAREALEPAGYEVIVAESPLGLNLILRHEQPALVLIDVTMPVLQGPKLVEIIRRHRLHECALVLYSDRPEPELKELARGCGASGFICKTNDPAALRDAVARFLGH